MPPDEPTPSILFVDDEPSIRRALHRLFRRHNYDIRLAEHADEGLRMLEERPADVVVSDQLMPGMKGTEFLTIVRDRWPETIRLILSGYSEVTSILNAINEGGIYKYLTKPWNDEELRLHVQRSIEQHALIKENTRLSLEVSRQNEILRSLNAALDARVSNAEFGLSSCLTLVASIDAAVLTLGSDNAITSTNLTGQHIFHELHVDATPGQQLPPELEAVIDDRNAEGRLTLRGQHYQWRTSKASPEERIITIWKEVA